MTRPSFRKPRPFGSRSEQSGSLKPRKRFYIICEGEKTEKQYFQGVFNDRISLGIHQLIDIVVVEQDDSHIHIPHPKKLTESCIAMLENKNIGDNALIEYDDSIDEIWLIFDRDPETLLENQVYEIIEKCKVHNINIGFTNPTFEFWLLLHLPDIDVYNEDIIKKNDKIGGKHSKRFVEKELSKRFENGYNKNNIRFERFGPNIDLAINQEKLFKQEILEIIDEVGSNIGVLITTMKES